MLSGLLRRLLPGRVALPHGCKAVAWVSDWFGRDGFHCFLCRFNISFVHSLCVSYLVLCTYTLHGSWGGVFRVSLEKGQFSSSFFRHEQSVQCEGYFSDRSASTMPSRIRIVAEPSLSEDRDKRNMLSSGCERSSDNCLPLRETPGAQKTRGTVWKMNVKSLRAIRIPRIEVTALLLEEVLLSMRMMREQ